MTRKYVRIESAFILALVIYAYNQLDFSWLVFALLWLAPDVAMLGYLFGNRIGAIAYNVAHSYAWPALLVIWSVYSGDSVCMKYGLIWASHISMDKVLGYGLKLPTGFRDTDLGRIGDRI